MIAPPAKAAGALRVAKGGKAVAGINISGLCPKDYEVEGVKLAQSRLM